MDAARGRAPADRRRRRRSRSCRSATRRWTRRRAGPRIRRRGSPSASTCRSTSTPRRRTRPDRVKLADVRRGQYEGLKAEIGQHGREPDFGPPRMHPSAGAVAVGARPFLIAYNINLDSPDLELAKRIARRIRESGGGLPKVQANGFFIERARTCAQVSMNLLDFRVTPLWRVWETVRAEAAEDGDRAGRVRAHRARAAGGVPRRRRPRRRARRRAGRGPAGRRRGVPPAARLLADAGARAAARGRRPARTRAGSGVSLRVIDGRASRRADRRAPVVGAARGRDARRRAPRGARRRATIGDASCGRRGGPDAPNAPVVATWEGRIVAVGPRRAVERAARGRGLPARPVRPARRRRRDGHARAGRPAHPPAVRRQPRGRARAPPARRRLPRDPRRRRRDPLDGRRDARRAAPTSSPPTAGAGSTRCSATASTTIEAKSGYGLDLRDRAAAARGRPPARARRARSTSCRRGSARTPSRPSSATGPTAPRPTSATCIDEQLPGVAAQGRARVRRRVLRARRVQPPTSRRRILTRPPRRRAAAAAARRRAGTVAAARSSRRRSARLSADHLATPSEAGHRRARRGRRGGPAGRRDPPAGDDLVPDEADHAPGPDVHRARRPGRDRDRLQPGHVADAEPAAGDDRRLPDLRMTPDEALAAVTINAAHALGLADEIGSIEAGKQADLVIWRVPTSRQIPYWPAADLVRTVVKRGRIVLERELAGRATVRPRRSGLAARLEQDGRRLGRQPRDRDRQLRLGAGSPPISWKNLRERLGAVGARRRRRHRRRRSAGRAGRSSSAARVGRERAADRHAGDVDRADVAELLLGQEVADLAEVDRVHPVELDDERVCLPRSAPLASSR